jgi:hypothetical protein
MKTMLKNAVCFSIATAALTFAQSVKADIVYQNTTGDTLTTLNPGAFEVGDEIILAGNQRSLTNFTFQYTLTGDSGATAQVRFYKNDGTPFNGYATPNSVFYDSGTFSIESGSHTLIFDDFGGPITLPDDFTWTVQFSDVADGETVGPDLFNPVTVGGNYNDYWQNNGGSWVLLQTTNGVPVNFAAQVEVVPEPSTIALGLLGCSMLVGFSRRNRR